MKMTAILLMATALAVPTLAHSKNDSCGVRFNLPVENGKLYVYDLGGKGKWELTTGSTRFDAPDDSLLFAYGIRGGRDNSGMALFKMVDIAKGAEIKDRNVRLSRTAVQVDRRGKVRTVKSMNGKIDVQVYQDVHSNIKDINGILNRFHTSYRYRAGENRDTFDKLRRTTFSFDEVKPIEGNRNWLAILFGTPAWAGVRSDEAIVALRATLKYYADVDPKVGEVICFTVKPAEAASRTQLTIVDLDAPGPYSDQDEILEGRKRAWKLNWNRKPVDEE